MTATPKIFFYDLYLDTDMTATVKTFAVIIVSNVESKNEILDRRSHICVKIKIIKNIFGVAVICVQDRVGVSQS